MPHSTIMHPLGCLPIPAPCQSVRLVRGSRGEIRSKWCSLVSYDNSAGEVSRKARVSSGHAAGVVVSTGLSGGGTGLDCGEVCLCGAYCT